MPRHIKRQTFLSDEVTIAIASRVANGSTFTEAAYAVDCDRTTIPKWRARGLEEIHRRAEGYEPDDREDRYVVFAEALERAEKGRVNRWLERLEEVSAGGDTARKTMTVTKTVECAECHHVAQEVTSSVTEEVYRIDAATTRWLLERLGGSRFRRHDHLDLATTPDELVVDFVATITELAAILPPECRETYLAAAATRLKAIGEKVEAGA
jgi:hypothetical protein